MGMMDALLDWFLKPGPTGTAVAQEQNFSRPGEAGTESDAILSVLVADLSGPEGPAASDRIAAGFDALTGMNVQRINQSVFLSDESNDPAAADSFMVAEEQGRDWLFQRSVDVLIWGVCEDVDKSLSLRFLSLNPAPEGRPGVMDAHDSLEIPAQYSPELEGVIIACALAAGGPTRTGPRTAAMEALHERAFHVRSLVKQGLEDLSPAQRLSVLTSIANVVATGGIGKDGAGSLSSAAAIYRKAITAMPDETTALQQAALHGHLADTLLAKAAGDPGDKESLGQAVTSCQAAIDVLDEGRHARDWAQSHVRLGLATYRSGVRSSQPKLLKEAVLILRKSLKIYSKATSPGKWAEVMNHIGVIMTAMGEEINNDVILQQALKIFGETLSVRRRETLAPLWAQTTNNMGAAAFALAKRSKDKALMEKAAMAFEGAAEVYREVGQQKRVTVIEKNLHLVQRRLELM